jgi:hypothetical protein
MATVKKNVTVKPKPPEDKTIDDQDVAIDSAKQDVLDLLKDMGIEADASKSMGELIGYLRKHTQELEDKVIAIEAGYIEQTVNKMKGNTNISNEEFLRKLAMLGVQPLYVQPFRPKGLEYDTYLFNEVDVERFLAMPDEQASEEIWSKIRFSGIEPVSRYKLFQQSFDK